MRTRPTLYLATMLGCLALGLLLAGPAYAADQSKYAGIEEDDLNPLPRYASPAEQQWLDALMSRPYSDVTADMANQDDTAAMTAGNTKNILLTGYWPPSNEMLRKFSTDPDQNPDGWQGQNWEDRGYDVYAYFPEFPGGTGSNPKGDGDFEVDYQDVSEDFWRITNDLHPVAILSYGQGAGPWEIEYNARNLSSWSNDYRSPRQPTPAPPDGSVAAGYVRQSTLPVQAIADAINNAGIGVSAWVDWSGNPGAFLCEYMAYHDAWYQSLHSDASDSYRCLAAGFTHVASSVSVSNATAACEIALRQTIYYLDSQLEPSFTLTVDVVGNGTVLIEPDLPSYDPDTEVTLTAIADNGDSFSTWSGDVSSSANPVTITMDSDKQITAEFTDTTAPTPDPMTWATVPHATGSSSIAMTGATASDASDVEYYFACVAGSGNDSGWQDSLTYEDTGLEANTEYAYRVKARDKSVNQNETGWSSSESATTTGNLLGPDDFESSFGNWSDGTADDFDWTRHSGETPSNGTGPSVDHTAGTSAGHYLYAEASNPNNPDKTALLESSCITDFTGYSDAEIGFYYHMLGTSQMGTLYVDVTTNCTTPSWANEFSVSGNQGDVWNHGSVDLTSYIGGELKLRFRGVTGSGWSSDIAIDDVVVTATTTAAICGNGVPEGTEECDDGNTDPGDCCYECQYESTASECRASAGDCDVPEMCTGSSAECPADTFEPTTTLCRADAGDCDVPEFCSGYSIECPSDAVEPEGTPCDDGNPYTQNDQCDSNGVCMGVPDAVPALSPWGQLLFGLFFLASGAGLLVQRKRDQR